MNTFLIQSGHVNLTDPCYEENPQYGRYNIPAKNGTWYAEVSKEDSRVSELIVYHEDHSSAFLNSPMENFGVDSGQFGIFDSSTYIGDSDDDERNWYMKICNCHEMDGGVVPDGTGFVSSTGYGDGVYYGFGTYIDGMLVKFSITFISEEEEEE